MQRRLIASKLSRADPGLLRLAKAIRISLTVLATVSVAVPLLRDMGQPMLACAPAILFVMLGMLFLRDQTLIERQITIVAAFAVGAVGLIAALLLAPMPLAGAIGMPLALSAAVLVQTQGHRTVTIALLAVFGYYLGVFMHLSDTGMALSVGLLIPALALTLTMLSLLPDNPRHVGRRALLDVIRQAERIVDELDRPGRDIRFLEQQLLHFGDAAIVAEEQLMLDDVRRAEEVAFALANLEARVMHAALTATSATDDAKSACREAIVELARVTARLPRGNHPMPRRRQASGIAHAPLAWRPALRAGCAALVAMAIGYPLSPEHWYWSAIGVLVTFLGTQSSGQTVHKGFLRLMGTAAGAVAGFGLAAFVPAHPVVVLAGMLFCVFGWSYFVLHNYAPGIFFLTLLLGLVYGVLGQNVPAIEWLRLEETAIGALATFIMALWLMPLRTADHVDARRQVLIDRLEDVVAASRHVLAGIDAMSPFTALRHAERALRDLRAALQPVRTKRWLLAQDDPSNELPTTLVCMHWIRIIAIAAEAAPSLELQERDALATLLDRLCCQIAALRTGSLPRMSCSPVCASVLQTGTAAVVGDAIDQLTGKLSSLAVRFGRTPQGLIATLHA